MVNLMFKCTYQKQSVSLSTVNLDRTSDNYVLPSSDDILGSGDSADGHRNSDSGGILGLGDSSFSGSNYASYSASAILMMVFQFVTDNSAIHRKVTECLMALKDDLAKVYKEFIPFFMNIDVIFLKTYLVVWKQSH